MSIASRHRDDSVARQPARDSNGPARDPAGESETDIVRVSKIRDQSEGELVSRVHTRVAAILGRELENASPDTIRAMLAERLGGVLEEERVALPRADRLRIQDAVLHEIVGYGPIHDLLDDDTISEIMVNGSRQVWIERDGRLFLTDVKFVSDDHVTRVIQRIISPLGRRCDEASPMVDARLPDGSRVNAIIPPLALMGPVLTIRKFRRIPLRPDDLVANGSISKDALDFLRACVSGRLNILIAGGSGSGKTTLLNTLSSFISPKERIVTIEDAAELRLQQTHVIPLESRAKNLEGSGEVTIRDLLRNALRMRPDRVVVGECRGPEALDMLQAMNTGHDGSLATVHSNSARDALSRIESMVLMSGADLPLRAIREQIASALDLIVYVERMADGTRRVTQISEVQGLPGEVIVMQDLYVFVADPFDSQRVSGGLRPSGLRPVFGSKLLARGIELPAAWFAHHG